MLKATPVESRQTKVVTELAKYLNDSYVSFQQAGEAAKRASEAAELAKSRLHQMNNDLQVHCRIPVSLSIIKLSHSAFCLKTNISS